MIKAQVFVCGDSYSHHARSVWDSAGPGGIMDQAGNSLLSSLMTSATTGTKKCPHCAERIRVEATKCKHCGEFLDGNRHRDWNPGIAAVLSLLIPGAGQMYKSQIGQGFGWLICTPIGYVCFLIPGIVLHIGCVINAATDTRLKVVFASEQLKPLPVIGEEERRKNIQKMNRQMLLIIGVTVGIVVLLSIS